MNIDQPAHINMFTSSADQIQLKHVLASFGSVTWSMFGYLELFLASLIDGPNNIIWLISEL